MTTYNFSQFSKRAEEVVGWLRKEYQGIRTGRATPTLLDGIRVLAYGAQMQIQQLATVSIEDARTLRVTPWDRNEVKSIEKAIAESNLGLSTTTDENGVRVHFPELTNERRVALLKVAKEKLEESRKTLRSIRNEANTDIEAKAKSGDIGEDEKFRSKDDLQKKVDEVNATLDGLLTKKEEEIRN